MSVLQGNLSLSVPEFHQITSQLRLPFPRQRFLSFTKYWFLPPELLKHALKRNAYCRHSHNMVEQILRLFVCLICFTAWHILCVKSSFILLGMFFAITLCQELCTPCFRKIQICLIFVTLDIRIVFWICVEWWSAHRGVFIRMKEMGSVSNRKNR